MLASATKTKDDDDEDAGRDRPGGRPLGVGDFRKINLRALIAQWGGPTNLAKKLGYGGPSYLLQMVSLKPVRPLTEKTARKIETKLDLPPGWLDADHQGGSSGEPAQSVQLDQELLSQVVLAIGAAADKAGVKLSHAKFADVVVLVYEDALKSHRVDEQMIGRVLRLAK